MQTREKEDTTVPQVIKDYKTMMIKLMNRPKTRDETKMAMFDKLANKFAEGWPFKNNSALSEYKAESPFKNELERMARAASEFYRRLDAVKKGKDIGKMDKTELDSNLAYSSKPKKKTNKPEIVNKTQS